MKLLGILLLSVQAISLDRQEASQFLSRRSRRETDESRDDLELECIEKSCSAEELEEVYDFETGLWKVRKIQLRKYNSFIRTHQTITGSHTIWQRNAGLIAFHFTKKVKQ